MSEENSNEVKEDCEYTCTPYITKKDGTIIRACDYGKKVFKIPKRKK